MTTMQFHGVGSLRCSNACTTRAQHPLPMQCRHISTSVLRWSPSRCRCESMYSVRSFAPAGNKLAQLPRLPIRRIVTERDAQRRSNSIVCRNSFRRRKDPQRGSSDELRDAMSVLSREWPKLALPAAGILLAATFIGPMIIGAAVMATMAAATVAWMAFPLMLVMGAGLLAGGIGIVAALGITGMFFLPSMIGLVCMMSTMSLLPLLFAPMLLCSVMLPGASPMLALVRACQWMWILSSNVWGWGVGVQRWSWKGALLGARGYNQSVAGPSGGFGGNVALALGCSAAVGFGAYVGAKVVGSYLEASRMQSDSDDAFDVEPDTVRGRRPPRTTDPDLEEMRRAANADLRKFDDLLKYKEEFKRDDRL